MNCGFILETVSVYNKFRNKYGVLKGTEEDCFMALKDTMNQMHRLIEELAKDLGKAGNLNKAAAQRVRTGTIRFAKVAKVFRKESVAAEKTGSFKRKSAKGKVSVRKKTAAKKTGKRK